MSRPIGEPVCICKKCGNSYIAGRRFEDKPQQPHICESCKKIKIGE